MRLIPEGSSGRSLQVERVVQGLLANTDGRSDADLAKELFYISVR